MTAPWCSAAILKAAQAGDTGTVIKLVRKTLGRTQMDVAAVCGYSQPVISRIEQGHQHAYDIRFLRRIAHALGIPPLLLGVADSTDGLEELAVNRREFVAGAGAFATSVFLPTSPGPTPTAEALRAITATHRRLDATLASRELADAARSHLRLVSRATTTTSDREARRHLAGALSEVAGFTAWLHWDMYDLGSARRHYELAIGAARKAADPILSAYMTGSVATFAAQLGDASDSLALVASARRQLGQQPPAIADTWLCAVAALAHAAARDERSTLAALDQSRATVERVPAEEPPPWPWVFTFDHANVAAHQLACAVRLGRPKRAFHAAAEARRLLDAETKQASLWRLDLADAHLQNGDVDEAFGIATAVLDLAEKQQTLRVIERARTLRRDYTRPSTPGTVRDFDDRLRAIAV